MNKTDSSMKEDTPQISIIMPTYNHGSYIRDAIQSVINQTFTEWELIIINNFSTDKTVEIVNSISDDRIKIINFSNEGVVARSRNKGLSLAKGKYIAFLDSDDMWQPRKLEDQVALLQANQKLLGVCTAMCFFPAGTRVPLIPWFSRNLSYPGLLINNQIFDSTVVLRREVYEKIGDLDEDPRLRTIEDYDYWLRILKTRDNSIRFLDKVLVKYRISENNLSGIGKKRDIESELLKYDFLFRKHECPYASQLLDIRKKEFTESNVLIRKNIVMSCWGKIVLAIKFRIRRFLIWIKLKI